MLHSKEYQTILNDLTKVIDKKTTLPILENIYFSNGKFYASNCKAMLTIETTYKGPDYCVNPSIISKFLARKNENINIIINGSYQLSAGSKKINLELKPNYDFLHPVGLSNFNTLTNINIGDLSRCLQFVSTDELRESMCGASIKGIRDYKIELCATDAHILHLNIINDNYKGEGFQYIIPSSILKILKSLKIDTSTAELSSDGKYCNLLFVKDDLFYSLTFKPIDWRYPNYEAVIPSSETGSFTIDNKELVSSIKESLLFSNKQTNKVTFNFESDEILAQDLDFKHSYKETLNLTKSGDLVGSMAFNGKLLLTILSNISKTVNFSLSGYNRAAIIKENKCLYLAMPLLTEY